MLVGGAGACQHQQQWLGGDRIQTHGRAGGVLMLVAG